MSALDQAFIKAYSQQNPPLTAPAMETAKKTCAQMKFAKAAISAEPAKSTVSAPGAAKNAQSSSSSEKTTGRAKRKAKSPGKLATDSIFEALQQLSGTKTAITKKACAKKSTSSKRTKKAPTTAACHSSPRAQKKSAKKPTTKTDDADVPPTVSGLGMSNTIYRLDPPSAVNTGGATMAFRPTVPAPHTDVIFSVMESALPQRESVQNQDALPFSETQSPKNPVPQKTEPALEKKITAAVQTAQDVPGENPQSPAFSDGWTEDFTRAFSNLAQNTQNVSQPESVKEQEFAKTPAEIIASLSAKMKQYASQQVPLPERKIAREETPDQNKSNYSERNAALEKNKSFSGINSKPETKSSLAGKGLPQETKSSLAGKGLPQQTKNTLAGKNTIQDKITASSGRGSFQKTNVLPAEMNEGLDGKSPPENADAVGTPTAPAIRLFQPMLQVDHFAWPKVCGRLETGANAELDRVIETLVAAQIRGKRCSPWAVAIRAMERPRSSWRRRGVWRRRT